MKKTHGTPFAVLALLLCLAACSQAPDDSSASEAVSEAPVSEPPVFSAAPLEDPPALRSYSILCTFSSLNSERNTQLARGIQDHFDALGTDVVMQDSRQDAAVQAEAFHNYIAQDVTGILCFAAQPAEALAVAMEDANAQGVKVLAAGTGIDGAAHCPLPTEYDCGALLGRDAALWLTQNAPGGTAVLLCPAGHDAEDSLDAGILDGLEDAAPGAQLLRHTVATPTEAGNLVAALLDSEEAPSLILACDDTLALAAAEAVAESETDAAFYIGSIGAGEDALEAIAAGRMQATVDPKWYETGKALADAMLEYIADGKLNWQSPQPTLINTAALGNSTP